MRTCQKRAVAVFATFALGTSLLAVPSAPPALAATVPAANGAVTDADVVLTFPDVQDSHWARAYVARLAASGIVTGYEDGSFKPKNNVTQEEAIVMAIRMMGLEEEARANGKNVVLGELEVGPFFVPYVYQAVRERIINYVEESTKEGDPGLSWGKRHATREWLAKLVITAIGRGEEAANAGLPDFADADQISADAAGYVKIAVDLGIVTGFDSDNTFRPKGAVTRAEIAAFFSRADKYLPEQPGRTASGYVAAVYDGRVQLRSGNNQVGAYALDPNVLVFTASGKAASVADLRSNQQVKLVLRNNTVYYIEILNDSVPFESIEGKLAEINLSEMTMTLTDAAGVQQEYKIASNAAAFDASGAGISLTEIAKHSTVRVERLPGATEISNVVLLRLAYNKSGQGTVRAVDQTAMSITVRPADGTADEKYPIDPNATIQLQGQPIESLTGIKPGDTIAYEVVDGTAAKINIVKQRHVTEIGELINFADDSITVLDDNNELKAYFLSGDLAVAIDGLDNAVLSDLQRNDKVELSINGNTKQVEKITVLNRQVSDLKQMTILKFDPVRKYVTVVDREGTVQLFNITDKTEILLDGEAMSSQLYSIYLIENRKINLTVSENQLLRMNTLTKLEGEISSISLSERIITLNTSGGTVALPYLAYITVDIPRRTGETINNLAAGMKVRVNLDNSQVVQQIQVKKSFVYTLSSVDTTVRRLNMIDGENTASSILLDAAAPIYNTAGQPSTMAALRSGDILSVNYYGESLLSVSILNVVSGKIGSIDPAAGKLSIIAANTNNVREFEVTDGVNIELNGKVINTLSSLKAGDRVQVAVDGTGVPYVAVATELNKTFVSYNAQNNEISFRIAKLTDQRNFPISTYAYIHNADGSQLDLSQLKDGDQLKVYLIDGKIVELVK